MILNALSHVLGLPAVATGYRDASRASCNVALGTKTEREDVSRLVSCGN
jgi:hypothetical protein